MDERLILEQKIKDATNEFHLWRRNLNELEKQYKQYKIQDMKNKYTNTYWIYKNNCYSMPETKEDYWDVFYYIQNVDNIGDIEVLEFSIDRDNRLEIKQKIMTDYHFDQLEQIDKPEMQKFWNIVKKVIDSYNEIFE